jgi:predicted oxidoreductase
VLLCDERIRTAFTVTAPYPHGQVIDRIAAAREAGGRYASARTKEELVDVVAGWGVARKALAATLDPEPFIDPPFHALEVQPAITFPFGGLRVDPDGRVLDRDGTPVPGLFAAGADAGGLQDRRYVGGLALGLVFGPRAARTAIKEGRAVAGNG